MAKKQCLTLTCMLLDLEIRIESKFSISGHRRVEDHRNTQTYIPHWKMVVRINNLHVIFTTNTSFAILTVMCTVQWSYSSILLSLGAPFPFISLKRAFVQIKGKDHLSNFFRNQKNNLCPKPWRSNSVSFYGRSTAQGSPISLYGHLPCLLSLIKVCLKWLGMVDKKIDVIFNRPCDCSDRLKSLANVSSSLYIMSWLVFEHSQQWFLLSVWDICTAVGVIQEDGPRWAGVPHGIVSTHWNSL